MYFAANNRYSDETDIGFCNTWYVLAFSTKAQRDAYVENAVEVAARAIKRNEIRGYIFRTPKPFSGERYIIADYCATDDCLGEVMVGNLNEISGEALNK